MNTKTTILVHAATCALTVLAAHLTSEHLNSTDEISSFYAANLRDSLFNGFLTLAGFLFGVKTFAIVLMKKEVYDSEAYASIHRQFQKENSSAPADRLAPLKNFNNLLFGVVSLSMLTALLQFTLGFLEHWIASSVCIGSSIGTVLLFAFAMWQTKVNMDAWLRASGDDTN